MEGLTARYFKVTIAIVVSDEHQRVGRDRVTSNNQGHRFTVTHAMRDPRRAEVIGMGL